MQKGWVKLLQAKCPNNEETLKNESKNGVNLTYICFAYDDDLIQMYSFYCARYKDLSFEEFLNLGIEEFTYKLRSLPKSEPLSEIIKSRVINLSKIKDKEERKYWRELKQINKIPDIYIPNDELDYILAKKFKNNSYGGIL